MADYQSDRTGASIDQVLDNADAGNIGKDDTGITNSGDVNSQSFAGWDYFSSTSPNNPFPGENVCVMYNPASATTTASQTAISVTTDRVAFRRKVGGTWQPWREIYHDNGNGVTAAQAATAIKGAKDGNIGLNGSTVFLGDCDTLINNGFYAIASSATNKPISVSGTMIVSTRAASFISQIFLRTDSLTPQMWIRQSNGGPFSSWKELYHTGNTGVLDFSAVAPLSNTVTISESIGKILINRSGTTGSQIDFYNDNGAVGSISTSGVSTQYNTSSDNRLKDPIGKPTDADIDAKFNDIYDTFTLFNWKNNPDGEAVWGFLAHDVIDKGLDFGSEGEGPRSLNIGDVYETIPAETEQRPVMETVTDEDGNEIEQQATDK